LCNKHASVTAASTSLLAWPNPNITSPDCQAFVVDNYNTLKQLDEQLLQCFKPNHDRLGSSKACAGEEGLQVNASGVDGVEQ
jgi:hypothetical protein